ncbi:glycerol-3-phosphate dehydrogenase/oxidase [Massilia sp. W12]|uniref:glycerol-3-phosphate dehydrogenase/oxidase n=1 Tax=Massilia sp. W12 TaxID=3126507 RepID=UPI0030CFF18F
MWARDFRSQLKAHLQHEWDLVVIGGGITGAGILLEAARRGLRVLLMEQRDFAWGTSSRSSKLVHGGLRYLKEGKFGLTRESVQEREALLHDAWGLVTPQSFAFADYQGRKPGRWLFALGLAIYDLIAGRRGRHYFSKDEFNALAPHIGQEGLQGGMCYADAKTDDARLVLRVLQEADEYGGVAVNYLAARELTRNAEGVVDGVKAQCHLSGAVFEMKAKLVINATGAWADRLRPQSGQRVAQRIRPLRGSHLLFPAWRLPLAQAVSLMHPRDGRPVFAYPWEGVTLVGTTDVDHSADLQQEAVITQAEVEYLMEALHFQFPHLGLQAQHALSSYAGVRPVVDTGAADPSKEGRDHVLWLEQGLLTVTGGKLTTFRTIALDTLRHAAPLLKRDLDLRPGPIFAPGPGLPPYFPLTAFQRERLEGRYGRFAAALLSSAHAEDWQTVGASDYLWAELRWMLRNEAVFKLEDLMLRRSRLGILLAQGARAELPRILLLCKQELNWSEERCQMEASAWLDLWQRNYSLPQAPADAEWQAAILANAA